MHVHLVEAHTYDEHTWKQFWQPTDVQFKLSALTYTSAHLCNTDHEYFYGILIKFYSQSLIEVFL